MDLFCQKQRLARAFAPHQSLSIYIGTFVAFAAIFGCASPGPPRSPSLNLPQPVTDLTASRTGNLVELRFTVPHLSTDKLPLADLRHRRPTELNGTVCRELKPAPCIVIASLTAPLTETDHTSFTWHETLPAVLVSGAPRLLSYRVEFLNKHGKSAGRSNPAFTAAGAAPAPVAGLQAEGTRSGVLLQWTRDPSTTDILLHRIALEPKPVAPAKSKGPLPAAPKQDDLWLNANSSTARTLDTSVAASTPYRYTAVRRILLTFDKHPVELRSEVSPAIDFTLQPKYPPAAPTGLEATGFLPPDGGHFAVDLIWQPISDAGITDALAAALTGYNVYRETLGSNAIKRRLTTTPAPEPSFHDATADPKARYRYSVTAVDGNGNESKAATFTLEPSAQ